MKKINLGLLALFLTVLTGGNFYAQTTEKTTADAWRQALPDADQSRNPTIAMDESTNNVEAKETPAQIEKRILDLELKLTDALKKRDAVALKLLLSDDFMPVGTDVAESQANKTRFIEWATKNLDLKSYVAGKTTVRVYRTTAVVTVPYKQQAVISGLPSNGDFVATNVWVKNGKQWQAVSHHVSQLSKP